MIKILVVDDEHDILDECSEALTDEGYQALYAHGADGALNALRDHSDLRVVVTDMRMPGMSGADLIKAARTEFDRHITFIMMSGHAIQSSEANELDLNGHLLLSKPLDIERFLEAVKWAIQSVDN